MALCDLSLISGRYFDEISQDTGKYCFGVEDTLKALEMGAVEILIVYENLDTMRYVLRCHGENTTPENGKLVLAVVQSHVKKNCKSTCSFQFHKFLFPPDEKILYLTPEQEKDKSHFTDKEVN